jgi:probable blue pigment (indigoidine) exporter
MATGTVLIDRWGRMGTPLETTTWQLIFGGAMLLPVALCWRKVCRLPRV